MFLSIVVREPREDFHPLLLLFLDLDIENELFVEVARAESGVVGDDVIHCVVFPNGFLAVWAVDRDVRAWRGCRRLFCRTILKGGVETAV